MTVSANKPHTSHKAIHKSNGNVFSFHFIKFISPGPDQSTVENIVGRLEPVLMVV